VCDISRQIQAVAKLADLPYLKQRSTGINSKIAGQSA
jgi:hypothetical protein